MTETTSTALVITKTASLPEVLTAVLRDTPDPETLTLAVCDRPVVPTVAFTAAVKRVTSKDVEPVTVTERRVLTTEEVDTLSAERLDLDALDAYVKARREAQKTMVFNHLDIEMEDLGSEAERDQKTGHFKEAGQIETTGDRVWKRELRKDRATLDEADVNAYAEDPDNDFDHEDYLSVTSPVRVFDEAKATLLMRKAPAMMVAMFAAVGRPGKVNASLNHRKKK